MAWTARLLLLALVILGWYSYKTLKYYRIKQNEGVPQPPPNIFLGHMKVIGEFYRKGDIRRHIDYVFMSVAKSVGTNSICLFDVRPASYIICVVLSHEVAEQISRATKLHPWSTPKSPTMTDVKPIVGSHSIIMAQGETWKGLRKRYNAGFAPQHIMSLLSRIVEKTSLFLDVLDAHARAGDEFTLDHPCVNLTFDIIGAVVMDMDFDAQRPKSEQSDIVRHYSDLLSSFTDDNGAGWLYANPFLKRHQYRLGRAVDSAIKSAIKQKFAEMKAATKSTRARSVLALSLQDVDEMDEEVLQITADQVKSFLFAGHDTTSILLQWTFYELSRSPRVLATLRAELDDVLGRDADPRTVLLARGEDAVKRLTYTSAVIKEILRLYPPAGTARMAPKGTNFFIKLPEGKEVCLDGMVIYNCATAIQRDPAVYGDTGDDFVPERWLGDTDTHDVGENGVDTAEKPRVNGNEDAKVPAGAWRPFERGPRNCIGQELANLEARVILACAVRRYDFVKVGMGELALDEKGRPVENAKGQYEVKSELFNTRQVTAKPVDHMRMRVKLHQPL
ncbi:hypothetical protein H2199_005476 [Coniosporium tulheliwenetii]|uniref:Uncharacterized protein n=1 Tax=Coniosporium tulheliwenetii TaxID=3383036 RepID=A0ACC2Z1P8_9PEZI|nr:hypothetical protein H2199_005476 [Cladosporium sp. JES 115]